MKRKRATPKRKENASAKIRRSLERDRQRHNDNPLNKPHEDAVPLGATRRAFDREDLGGGPPGSPLGDGHAAGDTLGGAETGGLAGSNVGDGTPIDEDEIDRERHEEETGPFAGRAGGAVGGTPAGGRASGGRVHGGFSPGSGSARGDSTVGAQPAGRKQRAKRSKK